MMMNFAVFATFVAVVAGNTCPDGTFCPRETTCCEADGNRWGCCPFPDAVCCSDKEHCCPSGTTCDVPNERCNNGLQSHQWMKIKATKPQDLDKNVDVGRTCPDNYTCSDSYTCCEMPSGNYGCCPLKDAVCCPDKVHCCPAGSRCDTDGCIKGKSEKLQHFQVLGLLEASTDRKKTLTANRDLQCPTGYTGCPDEYGFMKCCPLPNAQCCDDPKIQLCCPEEYTCVPIDGCKRLPHEDSEAENIIP